MSVKRYREFEKVRCVESRILFGLNICAWGCGGRWLEICRGIFYPLFGYLLDILINWSICIISYTIIIFYIPSNINNAKSVYKSSITNSILIKKKKTVTFHTRINKYLICPMCQTISPITKTVKLSIANYLYQMFKYFNCNHYNCTKHFPGYVRSNARSNQLQTQCSRLHNSQSKDYTFIT